MGATLEAQRSVPRPSISSATRCSLRWSDAYLINTARGKLVERDAVVRAQRLTSH